MCGRPLAFRDVRLRNSGLRPAFRAQPEYSRALTEARSASAHQTAKPQHFDLTFAAKPTHLALTKSVELFGGRNQSESNPGVLWREHWMVSLAVIRDDFLHVGFGFPVGWDSLISVDRAFTCVTTCQRSRHMPVQLL